MNLNYAVFGGPVAAPFTSDYNLYYNNNNNVEGKSNEPHGIYRNPSLDASFRYPSAASPGVNAGADLSAFFTTDKDGSPRTVPWDIGAYEYIDTTPPTVSSTDPATGSINVGISSKMNVTFSELMDAATINNATFVVTGDGGVSGTISTADAAISTVATFAPDLPLKYGTTYMATITTGVKDLSSNSMAQITPDLHDADRTGQHPPHSHNPPERGNRDIERRSDYRHLQRGDGRLVDCAGGIHTERRGKHIPVHGELHRGTGNVYPSIEPCKFHDLHRNGDDPGQGPCREPDGARLHVDFYHRGEPDNSHSERRRGRRLFRCESREIERPIPDGGDPGLVATCCTPVPAKSNPPYKPYEILEILNNSGKLR
jgi:hypothetical protein